ncbi:MAG TPA: BolA family protein [Burkholderiales bacterium]|nr:BolA family protein [Burkholderiales bacterium]
MTVALEIEQKLAVLQPSRLQLQDDSALHAGHEGAKGGGGHYSLTIVSPQFSGKNIVARHRLIYAALGPMMQRQIHALAIRAYAPGEQEEFSQP